MSTLYVRVDDRLIHGQIVTAWCITLGIQEIIAIDDELASNAMMKSIMTMGVPKIYEPHIVTTKEAKDILKKPSDKTILVITRFCRNLAGIENEIIEARHINIGNCSKQPDSKYSITGIGISQVLSFTQKDVDVLESLSRKGLKVICQALPRDKVKTWEDLKKSFKRK